MCSAFPFGATLNRVKREFTLAWLSDARSKNPCTLRRRAKARESRSVKFVSIDRQLRERRRTQSVTPMKTVCVGSRLVIPIRSGGEGAVWESVVAESCGENNGYWYCDTCKESLAHNLAMASHGDESHTLAWICYEHGVEVP